jgi:heat shock protein HtpX
MNTIKTGFLLIVMSMLLVMAGYFLGGPVWMAVALGLALVMNAGAYWYSDKLALKMAGAREVTPEEAPELHFIVDEQARQSNLPKPRGTSSRTTHPTPLPPAGILATRPWLRPPASCVS